MGFCATIEASCNSQEQTNFSGLRKLIERVYEPITLVDFNGFLDQARKSGEQLSLAGADGSFISFNTWFDQLTRSEPDRDFISKLTKFSMQKMNESMKDLVSFFKLDRFCELRALYASLQTNLFKNAFLSKPNSAHDKHKTDLIVRSAQGKEISFQVKAANAKKARTAGLNLIQRVSSSSLDYLKQQFKTICQKFN